MGDILIGNPVDHPGIVRVEKLDELLSGKSSHSLEQNRWRNKFHGHGTVFLLAGNYIFIGGKQRFHQDETM